MSLIQFSFSLAATKKRNLNLTGFKNYINIIMSTEAWSLLFVLITQDLPCFILRIFLFEVLRNNSREEIFTLLFFTIRNAFMVGLAIHRIQLILKEQIKKENKIVALN